MHSSKEGRSIRGSFKLCLEKIKVVLDTLSDVSIGSIIPEGTISNDPLFYLLLDDLLELEFLPYKSVVLFF